VQTNNELNKAGREIIQSNFHISPPKQSQPQSAGKSDEKKSLKIEKLEKQPVSSTILSGAQTPIVPKKNSSPIK